MRATGRRLRTLDGVRISARHDPPVAAAGGRELAFVVAHGFTGGWRRPAIRAVVQVLRGYGGVVSFDFRGHGWSTGRSTVGDLETLDLAAAVGWARSLGYPRLATLGWSMGAAVALRHAGLNPPGTVDAVLAVSGPSRWNYRGTHLMRRVQLAIGTAPGRAVLALGYRTRVARAGWDPPPLPPDGAAARIGHTPVLLVHGDADDYFPAEHAAWLARALPSARLWLEPGFGHAESEVTQELVTRLAGWAQRVTQPLDRSARMPG